MPDYRTLSELLRQRAFYEAGGQPEGERDIDKLGRIFGTVKTGGTDFLNALYGGMALAKTPLELQKLRYETSPEMMDLSRRKTLADIGETEAKAKYYSNILSDGQPVYTTEQALKLGRVPAKAKVLTPGQTGEVAQTAREDRINKVVLDYSNQLENNYVLKELQKQAIGLETANELDRLAAEGNTVAGAALGMKQARGMGEVGVITNQDIARYVQSGKLSQKGADILSRWMTGKPTPATLQEIIEINSVIKDTMQEKIQPIYNTYVIRLAENLNIPKQEAARRLAVPYNPTIKTSTGQETQTQPGKSLDSYLKNQTIPATLRLKAQTARAKGVPENQIIDALKQDLGIK